MSYEDKQEHTAAEAPTGLGRIEKLCESYMDLNDGRSETGKDSEDLLDAAQLVVRQVYEIAAVENGRVDFLALCFKEQRKTLAAKRDEIADLRIALGESLKLQAHYAGLLNDWDEGHRRIFKDAKDWIGRLRETGTIP